MVFKTPKSEQRRVRNVVFPLVALVGSLSILFLAGEIALRLLGHHGAPGMHLSNIYQVDDPVLDWRHLPNIEIKRGAIVYRYNSSGFRDVDHAVEKPLGVTRIVVVGDSVTEGYGVEWASVFSSSVQSQLGDELEVITIAAGGLNAPQEVHLLASEGLRYRPDLVILNFVLNDSDFYTNFAASRRYRAKKDSEIGLLNVSINPRLKRLLKSSALIYFIKERAEDLRGRLLGEEKTDYYTALWQQNANRQKVTKAFDKLATLQREHHFDVLVITWPLLTDYRNYPFGDIHRWVQEQAENRGFIHIDLLPEFSRMSYRDLQVTSEDNVHPNALGHKVAAESFLSWYGLHKGRIVRPLREVTSQRTENKTFSSPRARNVRGK